MEATKKLIHQLYEGGNPILMDDGYWHVEWRYHGGGKTHITSFGWKDIESAKRHISAIMAK